MTSEMKIYSQGRNRVLLWNQVNHAKSYICSGARMMWLSTKTPTKDFDWNSALSTENKARTISLLCEDRDNHAFSFRKYGKACRRAAVLVPFCYDLQGRAGLIYNLRSENLNTHKGEISFPGGTQDPEDNGDPVQTALRETYEELGIQQAQVDVWTTCRVFPTLSTKMGVMPVVGSINSGPIDPNRLNINSDEVDHAFVITLEHLCDPINWDTMEPPSRLIRGGVNFTLPIYTLENVSDGIQGIHLWGLTAFITHLVLSALLPDKYGRQMPYLDLMWLKRSKKLKRQPTKLDPINTSKSK